MSDGGVPGQCVASLLASFGNTATRCGSLTNLVARLATLVTNLAMAHLFVGPDASATGSAEFFDINDLLASSFQHNQQQPRDQEDPSDPDSGPCWGALLTGGNVCTPGFKIGRLHFKNKYCDNVRNRLLSPPTPLTSRRPLSASTPLPPQPPPPPPWPYSP